MVSIIIPCFNDVEFIKQSVNSALSQTYESKEIIIVDDGSNVDTKLILNQLKPKIDKLITQENKGQSTARNIGIDHAKGEYVLVLDSDDFFEPSFCEEAINVFMQNGKIKIVSCFANLIYENKFRGVYKPSGGDLKAILINNIAMGSIVFKKKEWGYAKGYDEAMRDGFEDWEFYLRLLSNGGEVFIIEKPLFNYRQRSNSTTSRANKKKYELLKYIYIKHKNLYVDNYELILSHLLNKIEREETEKFKKVNSIEYKIGLLILKPLRFLKSLF